MIDSRPDKDRVKCPFCGAFIVEVKPKLHLGQSIVCNCPKCKQKITIEKK